MDEFDQILAEATQLIAESYFMLPVAGREWPIYRERVYCYELYHQLRLKWTVNCVYSLGGEVDKRGHPLIRGNNLDNRKPDFLVHVPGNMRNYAVIEVKPITAAEGEIVEDVDTLQAFHEHAGYERGLLLLYGNARTTEQRNAQIELAVRERAPAVEVWHHLGTGNPARRVL